MENRELTRQARESLTGNWGLAIVTFLIFSILVGAASCIPCGALIVGGPLTLGIINFSLTLSRGELPNFNQLFDGFKNFGTSFIAYLLIVIFTLLWTLLLIIPGIIAAISYSMTFYIIAEDDSISAMDAINKSQKMMYGNKGKYFALCLRFIGWILLSIITLGIGFLFLSPYMAISFTKFYEDIKGNITE